MAARAPRSGDLRHLLQIRRPVYAVAGQRAPTSTPKTIGEVHGKIEYLSGQEQLLAMQADGRVTCRVSIRYFPGLTPRDEFGFGTRTFNIISINNLEERNTWMICTCGERV